MTEQDFLDRYDPTAFPPVAVATDLVLLGVVDGKLRLLLVKRAEHPERARWALPGGLLQQDEDLDACAVRTARLKAGASRVHLRQFEAFGAIARDPRLRVVSIGYLGLQPGTALAGLVEDECRTLAELRIVRNEVRVLSAAGSTLRLAFDHASIVAAAWARLRADLDRTTDVFALLPDEFTLRELQQVHEAIRGEAVNKPAFRKRMVESGRIEPTGRRETESGFRPAELYRLREGAR